MRIMLTAALCLCISALAENPEIGRIDRAGDQAILVVESGRPVDSAAMTLARQFGIAVNVEDPPYLFRDDVSDVTAEASRNPRLQQRVLVPKTVRLEIRFTVHPDGSPTDVPMLLRTIVDQANAQLPYQYRIDTDADWITLIPTHTRDRAGRSIGITPLLDRHVTIARRTRTIAETAGLMGESLSAQTGLRVSCCQAFVAGIPWGMGMTTFEANDEPARSVLKRLIAEAAVHQQGRDYWLQRCDPEPSGWCFINLAHASR